MATFRIKRYNPEKKPEPYYEDFQLDIPEGATLLDCINQIKWTQDGSLSYRMSCRSAICGSCGMKANGRALLACQKQATSLLDKNDTITIEPLGNLKPIKDLVVDFQPFWDKINKVTPYLQTSKQPPEKERLQSPEQFRLIDDSSTCIMCGNFILTAMCWRWTIIFWDRRHWPMPSVLWATRVMKQLWSE